MSWWKTRILNCSKLLPLAQQCGWEGSWPPMSQLWHSSAGGLLLASSPSISSTHGWASGQFKKPWECFERVKTKYWCCFPTENLTLLIFLQFDVVVLCGRASHRAAVLICGYYCVSEVGFWLFKKFLLLHLTKLSHPQKQKSPRTQISSDLRLGVTLGHGHSRSSTEWPFLKPFFFFFSAPPHTHTPPKPR